MAKKLLPQEQEILSMMGSYMYWTEILGRDDFRGVKGELDQSIARMSPEAALHCMRLGVEALMEKKAIRNDQARQQLIGFTHSSNGYDIISLAEAMGLTKQEWADIKIDPCLSEKHITELDKHFK